MMSACGRHNAITRTDVAHERGRYACALWMLVALRVCMARRTPRGTVQRPTVNRSTCGRHQTRSSHLCASRGPCAVHLLNWGVYSGLRRSERCAHRRVANTAARLQPLVAASTQAPPVITVRLSSPLSSDQGERRWRGRW